MLLLRLVVYARGCQSRLLRANDLKRIPSWLFVKKFPKSLCFLSAGLISYSFWNQKRTLSCVNDDVIEPRQIHEVGSSSNRLELTDEDCHCFVERVLIVFRVYYLMILFSPALVLHLTSYIVDSAYIKNVKWRYVKFALQRAGPAFIKLGQWVSTRRDIFHPSVCETLSGLQRNCYTHSWEHTEKTLAEELGPSWRDSFDDIDKSPIGSGCVAQVYRWVLCNNGESGETPVEEVPVAVKVLHPGVRHSIFRDLRVMMFMANMMDRIYPNFYWISLQECVDEFASVMKKQVDMETEARNMETFKINFGNHSNVVFPTVIRPFVTKSILVETFEEGNHISEFISGSNPDVHKSLASVGIDTLLSMLFLHNFVHCDLHPGNILVRLASDPKETPTMVILDCGVATTLSRKDWSNFIDLFTSIVKGETRRVADLMLENAKYNNCTNVDEYRDEMDRLITDATQQLNLRSVDVSNLLSRLFQVLIKNMVKLESNFTAVMLAVMVIEGLGRSLDPDMDILSAARPFLLKTFKRQVVNVFD